MRHGGEEHRVAKVLHLLLASSPGLATLRLAVCDVYQWQAALRDGDVSVARQDRVEKESLGVAVDRSGAVLVSAEPNALQSRDVHKAHYYQNTVGKLYFARHGNVSRLL